MTDKNEPLNEKELDYLIELVREAWFYARPTTKLTEKEQMRLVAKLQDMLKLIIIEEK